MTPYPALSRQLLHRGRVFRFVSAEPQEANPARRQGGRPESWYLVGLTGHRWPAVPVVADEAPATLDGRLVEYLEEVIFGNVPALPR